MKKKPVHFKINLLPKDPFLDSPIGKALKWALSVGRYIVIFTELIVIINFGARFSLDRQITDLNDAINQKKWVIESYGDIETKVRAAQFKIEQYQQIEQQSNPADIFPKLGSVVPRDVRLDQLTIRNNVVTLEGTTLAQSSLNLLINNLQLTSDFHNVAIDKIEKSQEDEAGFTFNIRFETKPQQRAQAQPKSAAPTTILDRTQGASGI